MQLDNNVFCAYYHKEVRRAKIIALTAKFTLPCIFKSEDCYFGPLRICDVKNILQQYDKISHLVLSPDRLISSVEKQYRKMNNACK